MVFSLTFTVDCDNKFQRSSASYVLESLFYKKNSMYIYDTILCTITFASNYKETG